MRATGLLLLLAGCDFLTEIEDQESGLVTEKLSVSADGNGLITVPIDVSDNTATLMATLEGDTLLALETVYDPSGDVALSWEDWYDTDESLTYAFYADSTEVVFNWPSRAEDGKLDNGTWELVFSAIVEESGAYYYEPYAEADATIQTKADSDTSEGTVRILVVYADGVGDESAVVSATEEAVERWREIWNAYGADIEVSYADDDIDPDLDSPGTGGNALANVSSLGDSTDVTVVVGETIDGSVDYYGVAGSVPGSLIDSVRSAVVISWLANAGGDGSFNDDDIRLYGETLAHEVGHYTGLFHPVEIEYDAWDALSDTERCGGQSSCESALGDNNMFPYPVCGWNSCTPQDQLTDDQVGVTQRYTGTL